MKMKSQRQIATLISVLLLLFFFVTTPSLAEDYIAGGSIAGGSLIGENISECAGYLICQNFEGTGYDNNESWTEVIAGGGTINEDYATSPAPLRGSQSLYVGSTTYDINTTTSPTFTAGSPRYVFFEYTLLEVGTDGSEVFRILDESNNILAQLSVATWRQTQWFHGTGTAYGSTLTVGTKYFIWVEYTKGTGSDGVLDVYISTTKTKPATTDIHITNGTATADAAKVRFISHYQIKSIIDRVLVGSSSIGSVPD